MPYVHKKNPKAMTSNGIVLTLLPSVRPPEGVAPKPSDTTPFCVFVLPAILQT